MSKQQAGQVGRRDFLAGSTAIAAGLATAGGRASAQAAAGDRAFGKPVEAAAIGSVSVGYCAGEIAAYQIKRLRIVPAHSVPYDNDLRRHGAVLTVRGIFAGERSALATHLALDAHFYVKDHCEPTVAFRAWSANSNPVRFELPAAPDGSLHLTISDESRAAEPGLAKRLIDRIVLGGARDQTPLRRACRIGASGPATDGALRSGTYFVAVLAPDASEPDWRALRVSVIDGLPVPRLICSMSPRDREVDFLYFVIDVRSI